MREMRQPAAPFAILCHSQTSFSTETGSSYDECGRSGCLMCHNTFLYWSAAGVQMLHDYIRPNLPSLLGKTHPAATLVPRGVGVGATCPRITSSWWFTFSPNRNRARPIISRHRVSCSCVFPCVWFLLKGFVFCSSLFCSHISLSLPSLG